MVPWLLLFKTTARLEWNCSSNNSCSPTLNFILRRQFCCNEQCNANVMLFLLQRLHHTGSFWLNKILVWSDSFVKILPFFLNLILDVDTWSRDKNLKWYLKISNPMINPISSVIVRTVCEILGTNLKWIYIRVNAIPRLSRFILSK